MALVEQALASYISTNVSNFTMYADRIPESVTGIVGYYTVDGTDYHYDNQGYSGFGIRHYMIRVRATNAADRYNTAENIRLMTQGFQGSWSGIRINRCLWTNYSTDVEEPQDGSQTWYYWATIQLDVEYQEVLPNFG